MNKYDIGIVIVNYNVRHFLVQCLQSVRNALHPDFSAEIWVVDNASLDGSARLIETEFPDVRLIANTENVGFSAANNQAIRQMDAKYILLLNPDTVLEEETLLKSYRFMEGHPVAGALGVRMIDGSGRFLPESKRKIPDLWNSFCKLSYLSELFPTSRWFSGYNLGYLPEFEVNEVDVLCGAFMLIRHETLQKTGLLDEAFFMYGEDIDLSYRILKSGYKIYYFPETSIIHFKGESTKKSSLNYVKTFYGAMHIYVSKHYGKGNADLFTKFIRVAITFRALLSGIVRIFNHWILPVTDGVIIWLLLHVAKSLWAQYYFQDSNYYEHTDIQILLIVYAVIWVFFLWLSGHYDTDKSGRRTILFTFAGTLLILSAYALLPESMRTSRAIILIGTLVVLVVSSVTSVLRLWLSNGKYSGSDSQNIAIVAGRLNGEKLVEMLGNVFGKSTNFHFISPRSDVRDTWFTNDLQALPKVAKALKISEVIYSAEDISMKDVIRSMTQMESQAKFKIWGDDTLSLIGSSDKNRQGELFSLDETYRINQAGMRRYKRLFDIFIALMSIPMFPVLLVINGCQTRLILNIIKVISGQSTWIGYGGDPTDFSFLPVLPPSIIKYPLSTKVTDYTVDFFKKNNMLYAREYSTWLDIKVLWNNVYRMANKPLY